MSALANQISNKKYHYIFYHILIWHKYCLLSSLPPQKTQSFITTLLYRIDWTSLKVEVALAPFVEKTSTTLSSLPKI
jgi:hypothetical protein